MERGRDHLVIIKLTELERPPPNLESLLGADSLQLHTHTHTSITWPLVAFDKQR